MTHPNTPPLVHLGRGIAVSEALLGGKAAALQRLRCAKVPIPASVVVTADALEEALRHAGLAVRAQAVRAGEGSGAALAREIARMPLPTGWEAALTAAGARLGSAVAVRSSASDEDGQESSHAGQYLSRLGVAPPDVPGAVRQVWASLFEGSRPSHRGQRMAVLLQEVVDARTSGVLFTIHPVHGSWRELIIEATWGLGDELLAGEVSPQTYVVQRPRWVPRGLRRLAGRVRVRELEARLGEQEHYRTLNGGVVSEPLPDALRGRRALDTRQVERLARLGLKLERVAGCPQDVEWAWAEGAGPVVLQSRPITALGRAEPPETLWTRRFIGERWPEPATTLGWSLVEPVLEHFIAYPKTQARFLGGGEALRLVDGHPYVNATVFRHLAFKLPGRALPSFIAEMLPSAELAALHGRFAVRPSLRVLAGVLAETWRERRWRRFAADPIDNHRVWRRWRRAQEPALLRRRQTPRDMSHALARVAEGVDVLRGYVGIHVTSLLFANLSYELLDSALAASLPDTASETMRRLAVCPPGNRTLEVNAALHALARTASEADLDRLARGQAEGDFAQSLEGFLDRFGMRSAAGWEIFSQRWRDHPHLLEPLLRVVRSSESPPLEAGDEAWAEAVRDLVRRAPAPWLPVLLALVYLTRRYLLLRENQRAWLERWMTGLYDDLMWVGAELAARGRLERADDVALLTWAELQRFVAAGDGRMHLAPRRAELKRQRALRPPVLLHGPAEPEPREGVRVLQGRGVGTGTARGRVRVLRSLAEAHLLQPGEIVVATAIDPGWTPLFSTAGGVVVELGGVLSHGAVVAREYGLPMVVNVDGAVSTLPDGVLVVVDGRQGSVRVLEQP